MIEITASIIAVYNVVKGAYFVYRDAENVKAQYTTHQRTTKEYRQPNIDKLSQSQYHRYKDEFVLL